MPLRAYQSRAIESLRALRRGGKRRLLLVSPTGSGKTWTACTMIQTARGFDQRVLVIGHRQELVDQFYSCLSRDFGLFPGVMRGDDERTDGTNPVQVATIQTLGRRDLPRADLVFIDEAHRAPGDSYARVVETYPAATIVGLTATPCRLDGKPLREHFDAMVEAASYSELIEDGSIVAPIVYAPAKPVDLSKVAKVAGDYDVQQLEAAVNRPHVIGDVVRTWQEHGKGRSTVVFAVGIEHSRAMVEEFTEAGVRAAHLDGNTRDIERRRILVDLELGKLDVVSNVGVLCEGWDQPRVKCCVMARPTLSLTLWMQCAGRILRPWEGVAPVILDHAGNTERHGLPHEDRVWSLEDGTARKPGAIRCFVCGGCFAYVDRMPCPLCGYANERRPREVRKADGVLQRIDSAIAAERSKDPRRAFFDKYVAEARRKGFKPGYASAKYKDEYGEWPPWDWSSEAKSQLDSEWQARIEKRTREREFWQLKDYQTKVAAAGGGFTQNPDDE